MSCFECNYELRRDQHYSSYCLHTYCKKCANRLIKCPYCNNVKRMERVKHIDDYNGEFVDIIIENIDNMLAYVSTKGLENHPSFYNRMLYEEITLRHLKVICLKYKLNMYRISNENCNRFLGRLFLIGLVKINNLKLEYISRDFGIGRAIQWVHRPDITIVYCEDKQLHIEANSVKIVSYSDKQLSEIEKNGRLSKIRCSPRLRLEFGKMCGIVNNDGGYDTLLDHSKFVNCSSKRFGKDKYIIHSIDDNPYTNIYRSINKYHLQKHNFKTNNYIIRRDLGFIIIISPENVILISSEIII